MNTRNNFLAPGIADAIAHCRSKFARWFTLINRCNGTALVLLSKMRAASDDHRKILAATIFGRAVQSLQAAILLVERGMAADARASVRTAVETAMFQLELMNNAEFQQKLIDNHHYYELREASGLLDDPVASKMLSEEVREKLRATLASIKAEYPDKLPQRINVAKLAATSEGGALYLTIFRPMSNDATHTSIKSLARHYVNAPGGKEGFRFGPQFDDAEDTLSGIVSVYNFLMMSTINIFELAEHEAEVMDFVREFRRVAKLDPPGGGSPSAGQTS